MNRRGLLKSFVGAAVLAVAPHFPRASIPIREGAGWEYVLTPEEITRAALELLHGKLNFVGRAQWHYNSQFGRIEENPKTVTWRGHVATR